LIVDLKTKQIVCIAHAVGSVHDFKLYQGSVGGKVSEKVKVLGDGGYQGILKLHWNSEIPKKKPRGGVLSVVEKMENRRISRERVFVENVIAKVKVFKILSNKYRNRRRRHKLRMTLICGIINYENKP